MLHLISDRSNRLVNVTFDSTSNTLFCNFLNYQQDCDCTCHINYGICKNQSVTSLTLRNLSGNANIKIEDLEALYCYSVSATNVGFTVVVHGIFYDGRKEQQTDDPNMSSNIYLIIVYTLATVVISLLAVLSVLTVLCIYVQSKLKQIRTTHLEVSAPMAIYDDLEDFKETTINADKNVAYSTS